MGIDLVYLGIIITVNLSISIYVPPLGLNILAAHCLFGVPLHQLFVGVIRFTLINFAALLVTAFVPLLSLALAETMMCTAPAASWSGFALTLGFSAMEFRINIVHPIVGPANIHFATAMAAY